MVEVLVLVDFHGQLDDELKLKAGDVLKNVKKGAEDGWMEGELAGKRGVFPSQFVKEIPASLMGDGKAKYPRSVRKVKVTAKAPQRWCKAEYSYTPEKADELELTAGEIVEVIQEIEDGWWLGKKGEKVGAFPSNFVQACPAPTPDVVPEVAKNNKQRPRVGEATFHPNGPDKSTSQDNTSPKNNHKGAAKEHCKVMFDYTASNRDELSMKSGDVILVLRKETEDEGWWEGELNGKTGLFPDNFVMLLPTTSQTKMDKPPARKLTLKMPAKPDITVPEKKPAEVTKPPAQALKDQKAIKVDTLADKKVADVSKPQPLKDQKDLKDNKTDQPIKVTHAPLKKVAPPPPAPVKNKPSFKVNGRPDVNIQAKPVEPVKEKAAEADASQFDALAVSTSKLSHPTSDRPKMPGKRPPTNHTALITEEKSTPQDTKVEEVGEKAKAKAPLKEKETELPAPSPATVPTPAPASAPSPAPASAPSPAPASAPSPARAQSPAPSKSSPPKSTTVVSPNQPQTKKTQPAKTSVVSAATEAKKKSDVDSGDKHTVAELKSDIHSLKVLMEMVKAQYERDMLSVKAELKQERAERLALQVEVEKLKKLVVS